MLPSQRPPSRGLRVYQDVVPRDEALHRTIQWERANPPDETDPTEFDYALEDAVLESAGRFAV